MLLGWNTILLKCYKFNLDVQPNRKWCIKVSCQFFIATNARMENELRKEDMPRMHEWKTN